jgi:iron complex transport system substrate-binding protein
VPTDRFSVEELFVRHQPSLFILREGDRRMAMLSLRSLAAAAGLAAVCAACGSASSASSSTPTSAPATAKPAFPVTVEAANGKVRIAKRPSRIVSLSPTATEMLFAIGAGQQVVAVDSDSDYPAGAPKTSLSAYQPNVEAIAGYSPDLVVASNDPGGLVKSLAALKIPVLMEPAAADLSDSYAQLDQLGAATGHAAQARDLGARMRSQVAKIIASVPKPKPRLSVYDELDNTYYSVTSATFVGGVFKAFGLRNIADKAKNAGSGYPQLSSEYIVAADPDLIFLSDTVCCHQTPATVGARPGWSHIAAVAQHEVVGVNDDIASRWGPRIVDLYRIVARHVLEAEKTG